LRNRIEADVCVVGGGPAGSTAALRLAGLGYHVCLLEKHRFPRPHIGESLVPSIGEILELIGVQGAVEEAGFLRPRDMIVAWGGDPVARSFAQPGYQVDRGRFDQILVDHARRRGVDVHQPARLENVTRTGEQWAVRTKNFELRCAFLIDAAGRNGVLRSRKRRMGAPTLALYAYWLPPGAMGPETLVEAGVNEWFWGAPLSGGSVNATVFMDPRSAPPGEAAYLDRVRKSRLLAFVLEGDRVSPVKACDATCYLDEELAGPGWIKVGDAAFSIDPLSSQGVQVAMQSGLQAALAVHAAFGGRREEAAAEYRARAAATADAHRAAAAGFYSELRTRSDFWRVRGASA
jgi:flavin-dependent dehydrogenase